VPHHLPPPFSLAPPTSRVFSQVLSCRNSTLNSAPSGNPFLEERPMHKHNGKLEAIRRELDGNACPFCGYQKYQLVRRGNMQPQGGGLIARCSQCQRPHELDEDLRRILWM
jgi:hypothetical protein